MKVAVFALPIIALTAGCGGGGGATFSPTQATAAFGALGTTTTLALSAAGNCASGTCLTSTSALQIEGTTAQCPNGGTISVTGDFSENEYNLSLMYNACMAQGYTMDGDLTYEGSTTQTGSYSWSMEGTIDFQSEEASGSCDINLSISFDINNPQSAKVNGKICGQSLSG